MRFLLLLLAPVWFCSGETLSVAKLFPGGIASTVGAVTLDGNQTFGTENNVFQTTLFPGTHTLTSNTPTGYATSFSVCVNCANHLAASYISGSTVKFSVPINGTVDITWLYTPQPGTLQGSRIYSDGTGYTGAPLTLDSSLAVPSGTSIFSSSVSAGSHTISSAVPSGYVVSYSSCTNCTQHLASSFVLGSSVTVTVPPGGYVDVQFQYSFISSTSVVSPTPNQLVTGNLMLSVTGTNLTRAASVEYTIGSNRIARVAAQTGNPTFQTTWNSALASDGFSQIEVTIRDYLDNVIFQEVRNITLSNYGNTATVPLSSSISGSVPLSLNAYDKLHFPAYWQVFLDGEILPGTTGLLFTDQAGVHNNALATTLDTTLYPNGKHEFHFAFHSNDYPAAPAGIGIDFRGMVTQNVVIDNGRALMEILPNYLFVYTPTSTGVQLTCSRAFTNGDKDPCAAPAYSVMPGTSSAGVQVSSSGIVTGSQEGYGDIQVSDSGKNAIVHVWIRNTPGVPHFQTAGSYGTSYIAGKSLFLVAPFQLSPDILSANSQLASETKRAGVNTLNRGIYLPNSDYTRTFANWKQSFDSNAYASSYAWSVANGFRILGSGDDIVRRPGWEGTWITNWPSAPQAVAYAMNVLGQSGAGVAVDVIDEASLLWGTNPVPIGLIGTAHAFQSGTCVATVCTFSWPSLTNSQEYLYHDTLLAGRTFTLGGTSALTTPAGKADTVTAVNGGTVTFTSPAVISSALPFNSIATPNLEFQWFSGTNNCAGNVICNPSLPNTVLSGVSSWLHSATASVPLSWPPVGTAAPYIQGNWMKAGGVSDYASHYWDSTQQRRTYIFGMGARETQNSMLTAFLGRQSSISVTRPQIIEQSMEGADYLKFSAAGVATYTPPTDKLVHAGVTSRAVVSGIMTAAAAGTSGVKVYKYDSGYADRNADKGTGSEYDLGGSPTTGAVPNWQALGYSAATITKSLQEFVLGTPGNSPYLGRNIISGVRLGTNANLLIIANTWDGTRTLAVDLSAYATGNAVLRYRVSDVAVKVQGLGVITSDSVTLGPGEAALYLFPKSANAAGVDTVIFQPDSAGVRTIVRTNYLYSDNTAAFGDPMDCSYGCSIKVDRKLGDAFYTYAVLDSNAVEQCRSAALTVPTSSTAVTLLVGTPTRSTVCQ